jgi:membrane protease YdiL (CAAX protease family)
MSEPEPLSEQQPHPSEPRLERARYPFWTYTDLFVFCGAAVAVFVVLGLAVSGLMQLLHVRVHNKILVLLPGQLLMYGYVFGFLAILFRAEYQRPMWESLGWTRPPQGVSLPACGGVLAAILTASLGVALKTPDLSSPMKDLLSEPFSLILVGLLGITIGPLAEEVVFRGFMQPLFVRSLGAPVGVLLAAGLFGALHLPEYGNSWRHGLLITAAGAAFGWMRRRTGSTLAAAVMHAAYNGTFFVALLTQRRELTH